MWLKAMLIFLDYTLMGGEAYYNNGTGKVKLEFNTLYLFPIYSQCSIKHNPNDPLICLWMHYILIDYFNQFSSHFIVITIPPKFNLRALYHFYSDF